MGLLSRKKQLPHLSKYRMEKIRRIDRPTTLITDDIKQVPKRAGFFVRAFYGDLGPKAGGEIRRFITKHPLNAASGHLHWRHVPVHKSKPAAEKAPLPGPEEMSKHIKGAVSFPRCRPGGHLRGARMGMVQP